MPIYDYLCSSCAARTEVIHGVSDAGPRFCPACGAEGTLRKAFAPPAVHFKGSGWAKKDRSSSGSARAKPDAAAETGAKTGAVGDGGGSSSEGSTAGAADGKGSGSGGGGSSSDTGTTPGAGATDAAKS